MNFWWRWDKKSTSHQCDQCRIGKLPFDSGIGHGDACLAHGNGAGGDGQLQKDKACGADFLEVLGVDINHRKET